MINIKYELAHVDTFEKENAESRSLRSLLYFLDGKSYQSVIHRPLKWNVCAEISIERNTRCWGIAFLREREVSAVQCVAKPSPRWFYVASPLHVYCHVIFWYFSLLLRVAVSVFQIPTWFEQSAADRLHSHHIEMQSLSSQRISYRTKKLSLFRKHRFIDSLYDRC